MNALLQNPADGELLAALPVLGAEQVARIGLVVARSLEGLHQAGKVHGSLSPDAVLLIGERVQLLIGTFPLERVAPFMAPERAWGAPESQAGDVYALGAVLCAAAGDPATGLPAVPSGLSPELGALLGEMVAMEPARRPTASAVVGRLAELLHPVAIELELPLIDAELAEPEVGVDLLVPDPALTVPTPPRLLARLCQEATPVEGAAAVLRAQERPETDPFEQLLRAEGLASSDLPPGTEPTQQVWWIDPAAKEDVDSRVSPRPTIEMRAPATPPSWRGSSPARRPTPPSPAVMPPPVRHTRARLALLAGAAVLCVTIPLTLLGARTAHSSPAWAVVPPPPPVQVVKLSPPPAIEAPSATAAPVAPAPRKPQVEKLRAARARWEAEAWPTPAPTPAPAPAEEAAVEPAPETLPPADELKRPDFQ